MTRTRERGAAALEVAGTLPILLLSALIALQVGVVGWTVVETADAARAGARAHSVGVDPKEAVRGSLGGMLEPMASSSGTRTPGEGYRYTVEVEIPTVVPFSLGSVTRSVEMPVTE
ncbi:TadE/TadG family type IV pilus assembly protein [Janibacter cremeus]|uniref:TadE/TadG family type IV pilus assembly protein n=1 Tax=Janibacter cremeus TaxID=1285192 RepID=UPI0023F77202|nr:TadE/TadG family type IV pilus assembly protein [Janibacter cremeus]WEV77353.1 TadE/TadG family type IV pilus assembly protein [Janibacter cremeus]